MLLGPISCTLYVKAKSVFKSPVALLGPIGTMDKKSMCFSPFRIP